MMESPSKFEFGFAINFDYKFIRVNSQPGL
jgi:hypothetical protein